MNAILLDEVGVKYWPHIKGKMSSENSQFHKVVLKEITEVSESFNKRSCFYTISENGQLSILEIFIGLS